MYNFMNYIFFKVMGDLQNKTHYFEWANISSAILLFFFFFICSLPLRGTLTDFYCHLHLVLFGISRIAFSFFC